MELVSGLLVGFALGFGVGALFVWWVMHSQVRDLEAGWRAERAQYCVWGVPKVRPWPRPEPPAGPARRINPRLSNCILEGGRPAGWAQAMIDAEHVPPVDAGGRPLPPLPDVDVTEPWQKTDRPKPPPGPDARLEPPQKRGITIKWVDPRTGFW